MTCPCEMNVEWVLDDMEELERRRVLEWDQGILDGGATARKSSLEWVRELGNPPRGFFQTDGGFDCDDFKPAFVRGILMPTPNYNALSFDEKFALQNTDVYPRWRLFGGPFQLKQDADAWDNYLNFFAFGSNQTWISHGTVCIVPSSMLAWPVDSSVQWSWIYETRKADLARRVWNPSAGRYEIQWV